MSVSYPWGGQVGKRVLTGISKMDSQDLRQQGVPGVADRGTLNAPILREPRHRASRKLMNPAPTKDWAPSAATAG